MSKKGEAGRKKKTMTYPKPIHCVLCRSRAIRMIGNDQYFCADCCTEFKIMGGEVVVYSISEEGVLLKSS